MKVVKPSSFSNFIYPFTFNPGEFDLRVDEIEHSSWSSSKRNIMIWSRTDFFKDDLLPHINRYLNSESGNPSTAYLWDMNDDAMASSSGMSSGKNSRWIMEGGKGDLFFTIEWVQIALFRTGIGFFTIRAVPESDDLDTWLDFVHHFRFISGHRSFDYCVEKRTGFNKEKGEAVTRRFFPEPGSPGRPDPGQFGKLLESILVGCSASGVKWWRDIFVQGQMIPFTAIFIDDVNDAGTIIDVIYRLRNFFHSKQELKPSKDDLSYDHPSLLEYGEHQWFMLTLEGGGFACFDPPRSQFFEGTLTSRLKNQYFLLFLLTLQQRFGLLSISDRVSEYWLMNTRMENLKKMKGIKNRVLMFFKGGHSEDKIRIKSFEFIRAILLEFTARGHFTQVTQREKHHRFYRKCQEVFQIDNLYTEVNDEVREMHEFLSDRQSRRLEERVNRLGALIGVPAIVLSFLAIEKHINSESNVFWNELMLIVLAITVPFSIIILWIMKR